MDYKIPDDNIERFLLNIKTMIVPFGVDKVPEIMEAIGLIEDAVSKCLYKNKNNGDGAKAKKHSDRKAFIAIYKRRYLEAFDLRYDRIISCADGKLIGYTNDLLKKEGFSCDDYLKWWFNVFLMENDKFAPGTIKQCCSQTFLHKFLTEHKQERDRRKKEKNASNESKALLLKAREVARIAKDKNSDLFEEIVQGIKDFRDGSVTLIELRCKINKIEDEI